MILPGTGNRMYDVDDSATPSRYECLRCGTIREADHHPGECEECGGSFQNRAVASE